MASSGEVEAQERRKRVRGTVDGAGWCARGDAEGGASIGGQTGCPHPAHLRQPRADHVRIAAVPPAPHVNRECPGAWAAGGGAFPLLLLVPSPPGVPVPLPSGDPPSAVLPAVPPVLDGVVGAAVEVPRDLSPALAHVQDELLNECAFVGCDWVVVEGGFEVLVVALAALFGCAGGQEVGDADPVVGAVDGDEG